MSKKHYIWFTVFFVLYYLPPSNLQGQKEIAGNLPLLAAKKEYALSQLEQGKKHMKNAQFESAINIYQEVINIASSYCFDTLKTKAHGQLIKVLASISSTPNETLLALSDTTIYLAKKTGRYDEQLVAYLMKGMIMDERERTDKALKEYQEALKCIPLTQDARLAVSAYNALANLYSVEKEYDLALDYYHKAVSVSDSINWKLGKSVAVNNIADVYEDIGQYDKAEEYFQQAIALKKEANIKSEESIEKLKINAQLKEAELNNEILAEQQKQISLQLEKTSLEIKQLGGSIEIKKHSGDGSTFKIRFPLHTNEDN